MRASWTGTELLVAAWAFFVALVGISAIIPGWDVIRCWLGHRDAAAWAQAIGTFIAVVAGAIAVWWQARDQNRLRYLDDVRRLELVAVGVFQLRLKAAEMLSELDRNYSYEHLFDAIRYEAEALRSIPVLDIPEWSASVEMRKALSAFVDFDENWQSVSRNADIDSQLVELFNSRVLKCEERLASLVAVRRSGLLAETHDAGGYRVTFAVELARLPVKDC